MAASAGRSRRNMIRALLVVALLLAGPAAPAPAAAQAAAQAAVRAPGPPLTQVCALLLGLTLCSAGLNGIGSGQACVGLAPAGGAGAAAGPAGRAALPRRPPQRDGAGLTVAA